jgi:hypothetical protein
MPASLWENVCVAGGSVLAALLPPPRNFSRLRSVVDPGVADYDPHAYFFQQVSSQTLEGVEGGKGWGGVENSFFLCS